MTNEYAFVQSYMIIWEDKVPKESLHLLQIALSKVPEKNAVFLAHIPLKSPIIGLILGIFLGGFGIDRFYKGDIGLGIFKLITCFFVIGMVWVVIDFFLVWRGIKQDNLFKINQAIALATR